MKAKPPVLIPAPRKAKWKLDQQAGHSIQLEIDESVARPQGYRIVIDRRGVMITAHDEAGAFYAQRTFDQLGRAFDGQLPHCEIEDWPDFPVRGVMLDISRDKVPTMATLFGLVDLLASLKINQIQLYTEHTFAYRGHEEVWRHASPMTAEQIRELDAYCQERFIELVPNQNSFGHMERWLKHPRYEPLAECPEGFTFPWGVRNEGGFTLNPLDPGSLKLVEDLFDQLLPNFTSRMFNVGCDETFDLGLGKSKAECEARGKERVYLDFILKIHDAVTKRGKRMQFWGDIILHKPELIPELPKDLIALNWGYEANHPFAKETKAFADAGVPFYVCPGTSSWCSIAGRTNNAIENLKSAAASGLANNAIGYLNTDWGDLGHLQYLPISYLGFAAGAAYSWCMASNESLDLATALSVHVFRDRAGVMGQLVYDLGNVYQAAKNLSGNSSRFFWSLVGGDDRKNLWEVVTKAEFDEAERRVDKLSARLGKAKMERPDAQLIVDEVRNALAMLKQACRRGRWRIDHSLEHQNAIEDGLRAIIDEHARLWMARNRWGGLNDSIKRLDPRLKESQTRERSGF